MASAGEPKVYGIFYSLKAVVYMLSLNPSKTLYRVTLLDGTVCEYTLRTLVTKEAAKRAAESQEGALEVARAHGYLWDDTVWRGISTK